MSIRRPRRLAAVLALVSVVLLPAVAALAAADPYRPSQWGLERVAAPAAWGISRGGGQVIAIVDTGIDHTHPDLVDRLLRDARGNVVGRDFVDGDDHAQDANGHGTMVAGVAAATADNGIGIAGVAPEARLMPVRVLDGRGQGRASDVDAGIRWAVDHGATVVNLSLESMTPLPGTIVSQGPDAAVRYAWSKGVAVVAAAGNSGAPFTDYPSSSPVLLVGATDRDDRRANFSDGGRRDAVVAPGVGIVSTWCDPTPQGCSPDNRYGEADGTSFAAPAAAGAIAILRAAGLSAADAVERLRTTAEDLGSPGPDSSYGYGRIDVARAVGVAAAPAPSPTTTPSPTRSPSGQPAPPPDRTDAGTPPPSPAPAPSSSPGTSPASPSATPSGAPATPPPSTSTAPAPGAPATTDGTAAPVASPDGTPAPPAPGTPADEPAVPVAADDPVVPGPAPARTPVLALALALVTATALGLLAAWRTERRDR